MSLTELDEEQRQQALVHYQFLRPYIERKTTLKNLVEGHGVSRRTAQRWVKKYKEEGVAGLVRKQRNDHGQHRLEPNLLVLIEALCKFAFHLVHRHVLSPFEPSPKITVHLQNKSNKQLPICWKRFGSA